MSDEPPRIALVVVPGVGDDGPGETARALTAGLKDHGEGWSGGDRGAIAVRVPPAAAVGGREGEHHDAEVRRLRLTRDGVEHRVDMVEMRWSDLSSFPRGLVYFFVTLFGFALQLATVGLEAQRGMLKRAGRKTPADDDSRAWGPWLAAGGLAGTIAGLGVALGPDWPAPPSVLIGLTAAGAVLLAGAVALSRGDAGVLALILAETASWLASAIVVPMTITAAIVTTAFWLALDTWLGLPDPIIAGVALVGGLFLTIKLGEKISEGGWRYGTRDWAGVLEPRLWAPAIFLGIAAIAAVNLLEGDSLRIATADALAGVMAFGLRGAWLATLTAVGLALLTLLAALAIERRRAEGRRLDPRGLGTAVMTTALSPFLIALVGMVLFGGIAALAFEGAKDARWGQEAPAVRCLADPAVWSVGQECGVAPDTWPQTAAAIRRIDARAARADALAQAFAGYQVAELVTDRARAAQSADRASLRAQALERQAADLEADAGATPVDWTRSLYSTVVTPFVNSAGVVLLLLALLAATAMANLPPGAGRRGTGLVTTERVASHGFAALLLAVAALVCVTWTWAEWTGLPWSPPWAPDIWGDNPVVVLGGSAGLVLLAVAGRIAPVDFRKPFSEVGGNLERIRRYVDVPYDIATYLRIEEGDGVRTQIVARYRALLATLREREYDVLIVLAHSQGSTLSAAVLMGDRHRCEPEDPGAAAFPGFGVRPTTEPLAETTGLVTFGCPLRGLYDARLPGEYAELWNGGGTAADRAARMRALTLGWINVYRPGDYVGRSVFHDPDELEALEKGVVRPAPNPMPEGLEFLDVCLHSDAAHTGYWADAELVRWVDYAVDRALGAGPGEAYPTGYAPEAASVHEGLGGLAEGGDQGDGGVEVGGVAGLDHLMDVPGGDRDAAGRGPVA